MTWLLAVVLKPFAALVLFGLICLPARMAVQRWLPDGKFKKLLLTDLQATDNPNGSGEQPSKPVL
jgi:hypothetical protein